jgi:hypothetical protein
MATEADVRRIALSLPAAEPIPGRFAFGVPREGKLKAFVWVWMERVRPKKPRVPNHGVIAARVADLAERDSLLSADPVKFFTEPHYEGFPAVLVRLDAVTASDLRRILTTAWRCQTNKAQGSKLKAQGSRLKAQGSRLKAQGSRPGAND